MLLRYGGSSKPRLTVLFSVSEKAVKLALLPVSHIDTELAAHRLGTVMVPRERLELSRCYQRRILNPLRLPIPPSRHSGGAV